MRLHDGLWTLAGAATVPRPPYAGLCRPKRPAACAAAGDRALGASTNSPPLSLCAPPPCRAPYPAPLRQAVQRIIWRSLEAATPPPRTAGPPPRRWRLPAVPPPWSGVSLSRPRIHSVAVASDFEQGWWWQQETNTAERCSSDPRSRLTCFPPHATTTRRPRCGCLPR